MIDDNPDSFAVTRTLAHLDVGRKAGKDRLDARVRDQTICHLSHERWIEPGTDVRDTSIAHTSRENCRFAVQPPLCLAIGHRDKIGRASCREREWIILV